MIESMTTVKLADSLPQRVYSAKQLLEHEREVATASNIAMFDLMTMAGTAVFTHLKSHYPATDKLIVLAGKGNNGGDGFITARLAIESGLPVDLILVCQPQVLTGDALTAYQLLQQTAMNTESYSEYLLPSSPSLNLFACQLKQFQQGFKHCLVIDALFGIGFRGCLSQPIRELVTAVNRSTFNVISVDIPSGLNATTGNIENNQDQLNRSLDSCISATDTISFIAVKQGLLTGRGPDVVGQLYLAPLSINHAFQQQVATECSVQGKTNLPVMPARRVGCHKGEVGLVLAIGGAEGMPGAIRLSAEAALRAGAGLVSVACHASNQALVFHGRPELMLAPTSSEELLNHSHFAKAKVIVIGPGLGQGDWGKALFKQIIQHPDSMKDKFIVLDADGLNLLAQLPENEQVQCKRANWLLTPHPLEAARLLKTTVADIEADRFAAVNAIATKFGGICLLKGAGTLISDGLQVWINSSGNPGMASGGMGDVLAGICAASVLQFGSMLEAVRYACFIHGYCADLLVKKLAQRGLLASDIVDALPTTMSGL
ncbi:NAD(P)H-hydrate dehydratase [Endozoicomonas sp. G2_1]|uniref:NAD(P)H-hydrate dehydratase n=1 Tax=Endozoicomonas sp. G2_1 TaxID=2821091 RepID=UPI001ADC2592|nr:NAD(P)H-hydrate dehydratase [Endozoicomonas sp. G2_1]MBO9491587.1 NAD(P)H-hydrate dehydratase [Endozoicomonas sp. G2_1]